MTKAALHIALCLAVATSHLYAQAAEQTGAARDERWRDDLKVFAKELPARHINAFARIPRATFDREVATLDSAIPHLTDSQIRLRFVRLTALLGDGHTNVALPPYDVRLPVALLWTDDGPAIVNADSTNARLIGAMITAVNGRPIAEVADTLRRYIPHENELGFRISPGALLLRPGALRDMGLGGDSVSTQLTVTRDGKSWDSRVVAVRAAGFTLPMPATLPLHRQHPGERYWWTYVPNDRLVYIKYNRCEDTQAFKRLVDNAMAAIDSVKPLRVVVDVRDNSGGDSRVVQPLIEALRARPDVNRKDALFAIMGRATFSSGLFAANDVRTRTHATLVGEPSGERANHYGELGVFKLPNSGLAISYSTKLHKLVEGDGESFAPDVLAPPTAAAYIAGRDPAMEWILAHARR
jgi:hypothetical protein